MQGNKIVKFSLPKGEFSHKIYKAKASKNSLILAPKKEKNVQNCSKFEQKQDNLDELENSKNVEQISPKKQFSRLNFSAFSPTAQRQLGVVLSYINIAISTLFTLFYTPFLIRALGQSEFGLYSLSSNFIGYLAILDLGFGNALVVFTAKFNASGQKEREKSLHATIFGVYLAICAIVAVLGTIFTLFAGEIFSAKLSADEISKLKIMSALLTLNLAISFPFSIFSSILTAYENFIFIKIVALFRTIAVPICAIPTLLLGYGAIAIIIIVTAVNFICIIADFIYCSRTIRPQIRLSNFNFSLLKEIFAYSFFIFLSIVVDQVNWSVDSFILGLFCGTREVGIYAVAVILIGTFMVLSITISGVMLPKISKMVGAGSDIKELNAEFIKIGRLQFYVIFFICGALVLFGRDFIVLWAGAEYEKAYAIAVILALPLSVPLIQNLGISILQAKNRVKFRAIGSFATAILNVAISVPLAKKYGALGGACGTAIAITFFNVFTMNFYYKFAIGLAVGAFWREIAGQLARFLCVCGAIFGVNLLLKTSGVAYLIWGGISYFTLFLIASKFCLNEYEKALLGGIFKRIFACKR